MVNKIANTAAAIPKKTLKKGGAASAIRMIMVDRAKPEFLGACNKETQY